MKLCSDVLQRLSGRTLVTAESCTGGGIGAALTAIAGSSEVYKGGIICYTNWMKEHLLGVSKDLLEREGAVSEAVAKQMAAGALEQLDADIAISVTGLAGPGGDAFSNPIGTVFIGYSDAKITMCRKFVFSGDRNDIRAQAIEASLTLILEMNK